MEEESAQAPTLISWEAWHLRWTPSSGPPDLEVKPVDEKPFTNASGQPVPVHGTCNPMVTIGETSQRSGSVQSNGRGKAIAVGVQAG